MSEKERIESVIKSLGLTARQFAAEIRVQPGTISNMMAGRNNPSLDVMKRIMERYPTLNPEWLMPDCLTSYRRIRKTRTHVLPNKKSRRLLQLLLNKSAVLWSIIPIIPLKNSPLIH